MPSRRDALHILVTCIYSANSGKNSFRMAVGMGSSSHDLDGAAVLIVMVNNHQSFIDQSILDGAVLRLFYCVSQSQKQTL